ncbi:hypothetical protein [Micromonospora sp. CPCC 206060]|uniref:hypothetical protein n=1 Tax=Micromonospora sp. CPCC 206060 TaxID=3122406 RepID=UPI003FA52569
MALAVSAGGVALGRALGRRDRDGWPTTPDPAGGDPATRWEVVTVNRSRTDLLPAGELPEPLARLRHAVQVRLRPAPGGKGTELAARPRGSDIGLPGLAAHLTGDDPRLVVRAALRATKQLAETGQVLDPGRTPPTWHPSGAPGRTGGGSAAAGDDDRRWR